MITRKIYYLFRPKARRILRRLYYLPLDIFEIIFKKRNPLVPPRGKIFIGSGDFEEQGSKIVQQLINYGNLQPSSRVLDIGCGIGRVAIPLTKYLSKDGSYEGFDIVWEGIKWCKAKITDKFPNFRFTHIDLKNDLYNLKTKEEAKNFVFPYKNSEFDLVFLTSVFTHMLPEDTCNYISQINRVLKKGGICFATFFLMNEENESLMKKNKGLNFKYNYGTYYLLDKNVKEANVAFSETHFKEILTKKIGFEIINTIYGSWPGRKLIDSDNFQDILIMQKIN